MCLDLAQMGSCIIMSIVHISGGTSSVSNYAVIDTYKRWKQKVWYKHSQIRPFTG